jgi:PadR family transcriptional regulator, regulatory protein PadR
MDLLYNVERMRKDRSMNKKVSISGTFEEFVLSAILTLEDDAYGMRIRQHIKQAMGNKEVSIGALYTTLGRLETNGFISSWEGDPTPERGGRAKRYFKVEAPALEALEDLEKIREKLKSQSQIPRGQLGEVL